MKKALSLIPYVALLCGAFVFTRAACYRPDPLPELAPPPDWVPLRRPQLTSGDAELRGQVIDSEGRKVANALVACVVEDRLYFTHAAEDGGFVLDDLPAGALQVDVVAEGFLPATLQTYAGSRPVELVLPTRQPDPPDFAPLEASELRGWVEARGSAARWEGYELWLTPAKRPTSPTDDPLVPRRVSVGAGGRVVIPDLVHGRYYVQLLPPWASGGSWPDLLRGLDDPPIELNHAQRGPDQQQDPAHDRRFVVRAGGLEQRILDSDKQGRIEFVEGATVFLYSRPSGTPDGQHAGLFPLTQSDAQGRVRILDLPPGRYRMTVRSGSTEGVLEVDVPAGRVLDLGQTAVPIR